MTLGAVELPILALFDRSEYLALIAYDLAHDAKPELRMTRESRKEYRLLHKHYARGLVRNIGKGRALAIEDTREPEKISRLRITPNIVPAIRTGRPYFHAAGDDYVQPV